MKSTLFRLRSELDSLAEDLAEFVREVPVRKLNLDGDGIAFIGPENYVGELSALQRRSQLGIKRRYDEWFQLFRSVFGSVTNDLERQLEDADKSFRAWVELSVSWGLSRVPAENVASVVESAEGFRKVMDVLDSSETDCVVVVPDTNSIAEEPDPRRYRRIAGGREFTFVLLPTVLSELDSLKNNHRNRGFREKVRKSIRRVKGWRNQGPLRDGVTVDKTIMVKAITSEPAMGRAPTWLDRSNRDDRIIASVLEVQSDCPAAQVVLVTGDINLANKADVCRIHTSELPCADD